jgi:AcrR family transcriptional regulator
MPKIVNHDQYRKELLSKCFDLFAEKGYSALTMREIAKELRVSTGTLYHYFPSKKDLFWQLYEEVNQRDFETVSALITDNLTLQERIDLSFDYIAQNEEYLFKQIMISFDFYQHNDRAEVIENETLRRNSQLNTELITKILGIEDQALINFVMSLVFGVISIRLFEGDTISYSEQANVLKKMLSAYLEKYHSQNNEDRTCALVTEKSNCQGTKDAKK